ncbi:hypothetical protein os1_08310 [Comamonadaceae bacterium OS-1]|nr:hypothetical protein os1_08310 [Comamonadaceae bacterium OS-1]
MTGRVHGAKPSFLGRLALDAVAVGLLLVALAYYWLENAAHEWIGTGIFGLVIAHNVFNRRWWGGLTTPRRTAHGLLDRALTVGLLALVLALLLSSLMISQTVFGFLQWGGGVSARQVHSWAAYGVVVCVAVHLGFRWQRVMATARSALRLEGESTARAGVLRVVAAAIAAYGFKSSFVMEVGTKLALQTSLEWWDFGASVAGFFLHWVSIVGLYVFVTHYVLRCLQARQRKAIPDAAY